MKTIIVPMDFSDEARNAAIYASEFAEAVNCRLFLFHVYHIPFMIPADLSMEVMNEMKEMELNSMEKLQAEAEYLSQNKRIKIECITSEGKTVEEIITLEERQNPDLIILGNKSKGTIGNLVIGNVVTNILKLTKTPLLIIPENTSFKKIENIAFACDYNPETKLQTYQLLKEFASLFSAKLFMLNIMKEKKIVEVEKAVLKMKIQNFFYGIPLTAIFLEDADLIHGINEFAENNQIDIITMIPHRHNFWEFFHISNTKKMALRTHIPLLILPDNKNNL